MAPWLSVVPYSHLYLELGLEGYEEITELFQKAASPSCETDVEEYDMEQAKQAKDAVSETLSRYLPF
jgi:hypothetical protein